MSETYTDIISRYISPIFPIPSGAEPGGRLHRPVRAVLFDIYGTLLVSHAGDIHGVADNRETTARLDTLLKSYHFKGSAGDLVARFFRTIAAARESMRRQGVAHPEVAIDRIWKQVLELDDMDTVRRFAIEFEMIVNPCYPMPSLTDVFARLREFGVKMGIISNAQFFTPLTLQVLLGALPENMGFCGELIFYSYRHGVAKPSRLLFQLAARELERMGHKTETTLYVGNDMLNDILPARTEGFQTALFAGDKRSLRQRADDSRCIGVKPDLVITDWRQAMEWIRPHPNSDNPCEIQP